jgi:methionine-rich copper-binding protein CopC
MKNILLAACLSALLSSPVLAHSPLKSTSPADGAILTSVPDELIMVFGKPARVVKIVVVNEESETRLDLPAKKPVSELSVILPDELRAIGSGSYAVEWRALSIDGHAIKGKFAFTVE